MADEQLLAIYMNVIHAKLCMQNKHDGRDKGHKNRHNLPEEGHINGT